MRRKANTSAPELPPLAPVDAAEVLAHVEAVRVRTRAALGTPWFPLLLFGALVVVSAPVVALAGPDALAPLWVLASVGGMLATRRHFRLRARARGATGPARRSWQVSALMAVGCFASALAAGHLGGQSAALAAPVGVCLLGYAVLGVVQRTARTAAWVAVAAVVAVAVLLAGGGPWLFELTFGCGLMGVGAALRVSEVRA